MVEEEKPVEVDDLETITKIKVNVDLPEAAERAKAQNPDGVGLLRCEFMLATTKVHPAKLVKDDKERLYSGIS